VSGGARAAAAAVRAALSRARDLALARVWLRGCRDVGPRVRLDGRPHVEAVGTIELGANVTIASLPVSSHLVTGPRGRLVLGDGVTLEHGVAIAAHAEILLGAGTRVGAYAMLMDTDFHAVGDHDARPVPRPIAVGRDVRIGARAILMPGCRIGDGARIAPGAVVSGEIPAGALASGVPARVLAPGSAPDPAPDPAAGGSAADLVRSVVQETFELAAAPALADGPDAIPGWDSLGALKLLIAVEERLGIAIPEDAWVRVRTVADVVALAERRAAT
jgi:acetyltransferase-like isoleucine patch superfamily enzyme/acyl carrier protein